jgi:hypothetical protein
MMGLIRDGGASVGVDTVEVQWSEHYTLFQVQDLMGDSRERKARMYVPSCYTDCPKASTRRSHFSTQQPPALELELQLWQRGMRGPCFERRPRDESSLWAIVLRCASSALQLSTGTEELVARIGPVYGRFGRSYGARHWCCSWVRRS